MTLKELCLMKDLQITLGLDMNNNWTANIEPMLEVVDGCCLVSTCGRGVTVALALEGLCNQISGTKVRLNRGEPAERFILPLVEL